MVPQPDTPASGGATRPDPRIRAGLERAIEELKPARDRWPHESAGRRLLLVEELSASFRAVVREWVAASLAREGLRAGRPEAAEEWLTGPYFVLRNLHLLRRALNDIAEHGHPLVPGRVTTRPDGQVVAEVFPERRSDRLFFPGTRAAVWMEPGVHPDELAHTQAVAYRTPPERGRICLVLGAGNVSSIGPMDVLYKLFVESSVVLYKANPVQADLTPLIARGFAPLVERGLLRLVEGGAAEGNYLCHHPDVDEVHVTGSDRTFEAIVFGTGDEGERRKQQRQPLLTKRVTAELGNVSPVVVVPGRWSDAQLRYQAENIASMLVNNAGFNCNAARVIVQSARWPQREALMAALRDVLRSVPPRPAWYPGAAERHEEFTRAHPHAEHLGRPGPGELPWTLVSRIDPADREALCFRRESFCSLVCEVGLEADGVDDFLARATGFCNTSLWGTLNATVLVSPKTRMKHTAALERAVAELRYGTISVNHWAALGFGLGLTTWGAYPGHAIDDIQSGTGVVHNTLMFSRPQKSVLRTPFRAHPKPPWFVTHPAAHKLAEKLTWFEARPSAARMPAVVWHALSAL
jgi:hypothetical protein